MKTRRQSEMTPTQFVLLISLLLAVMMVAGCGADKTTPEASEPDPIDASVEVPQPTPTPTPTPSPTPDPRIMSCTPWRDGEVQVCESKHTICYLSEKAGVWCHAKGEENR